MKCSVYVYLMDHHRHWHISVLFPFNVQVTSSNWNSQVASGRKRTFTWVFQEYLALQSTFADISCCVLGLWTVSLWVIGRTFSLAWQEVGHILGDNLDRSSFLIPVLQSIS